MTRINDSGREILQMLFGGKGQTVTRGERGLDRQVNLLWTLQILDSMGRGYRCLDGSEFSESECRFYGGGFTKAMANMRPVSWLQENGKGPESLNIKPC